MLDWAAQTGSSDIVKLVLTKLKDKLSDDDRLEIINHRFGVPDIAVPVHARPLPLRTSRMIDLPWCVSSEGGR